MLEDDGCKYMDFSTFPWSEVILESNPEFQKMAETLENEIIETHVVHYTFCDERDVLYLYPG